MDKKPDGFETFYSSNEPGPHVFKIEHNGKEIPESPLTCDVEKLEPRKVDVKGLETRKFDKDNIFSENYLNCLNIALKNICIYLPFSILTVSLKFCNNICKHC